MIRSYHCRPSSLHYNNIVNRAIDAPALHVTFLGIYYNTGGKYVVFFPRRSRRRSGSGLGRVGSEVGTLEKKRAVEDVTGEGLDMMVMMTSLDNGPHRERAVDVPDSFIARNKTPPRYPPPSRANRNTGTQVRVYFVP